MKTLGLGRILRLSVALALGALAAGAQAATSPPKAPIPCDRACLKDVADQYFQALLKHSPAGLPLDSSVRLTENAVPVAMGQGVLWRNLTKAPDRFRIDVIDEASQQIATGGLLEVNSRPHVAALRIKVTGRRIIEIEQFFSDEIQPLGWPNLQQPRAALLNTVPADRRNTRGEMQLIAESYFDALTSEDSRRAPFADDCVRHESGIRTTGIGTPPERTMPAGTPPDEVARMQVLIGAMLKNCSEQIDSGAFADLWKVWPRRPIVMDEEKGLLATFPILIQNGDVRPSPLKGYPGVDRLPKPLPSQSQKLEIFKIHSGAIHEIEVVVSIPQQFGAGNGWDTVAGPYP